MGFIFIAYIELTTFQCSNDVHFVETILIYLVIYYKSFNGSDVNIFFKNYSSQSNEFILRICFKVSSRKNKLTKHKIHYSRWISKCLSSPHELLTTNLYFWAFKNSNFNWIFFLVTSSLCVNIRKNVFSRVYFSVALRALWCGNHTLYTPNYKINSMRGYFTD